MKKVKIISLFLSLFILGHLQTFCKPRQSDTTILKDAGIIDTAVKPKVFGPGIISTPFTEWSITFMPDQKTVYTSQGSLYWTIVYSRRGKKNWGKPKVASFSGIYKDTDPFITPDGKTIFFISNRPRPGMPRNSPLNYTSIWYANAIAKGRWGAPRMVDASINQVGIGNYAPSLSAKGTLYYCTRGNGNKGFKTYSAKRSGSQFEKPELVSVPGAIEIQDPFISPDERFITFLDRGILLISYQKDGRWTTAENLGPVVNNGSDNSSPSVARDGKTLYFSSTRIKDLYNKRDFSKPPVDYERLKAENNQVVNGQTNILMVPVHL